MNLAPEAPRIPPHLLEDAVLLCDRYALLPHLPRHAVFAEVGVATGDFSQTVMTVCEPALFVAIDRFRLHEIPLLWGQPSETLLGGRTHAAAYRERFAEAEKAGRLRILEGDSAACLEQLEDASIDVLYIDADHQYESVRRDLAVARRKVREDGWIIVNDYLMVAALGDTIPYGVVNATNEFMIDHDWGIAYFALQTRMFCDVALRPASVLRQSGRTRDAVAAENEHLRATIAALRRSGSWRVTAPLRAASRRLGRPLRRLLA